MDAAEARKALDLADTSRAAANLPLPAWLPPTAGLLFAAGMCTLGAASRGGGTAGALIAAGLAAMVVGVTLVVQVRRRTGVMGWSAGADRARRWKNTVPPLLVVVLALLVDAAAGETWSCVVFGLGLGANEWVRLARAGRV
ncbi:hypothetical protein [Streptomyces sp. NPDC046197]|uniref:hypothetical protein n=1 Tax=Streptomyces sp. NPDC046197 TaxID=3154337 RepID=UPI0033DDD3F4